MSNNLEQESIERAENDKRISQIVTNEVKKLEEVLLDLRQHGDTTDKSLFDAIKSTVNEIKVTLESEKNKR